MTPQSIAERVRLTRRFMIRKMAEYEALKAEIAEVGAEISEREMNQIQSDLSMEKQA